MLLFKPEHVEPILCGEKTQTRRLWRRRRCKPGTIHQAKTRLFGGEPFAKLLIRRVHQELLEDITPEDAHREGYENRLAYLGAFIRINKLADRPIREILALPVWVVEFQVVGA